MIDHHIHTKWPRKPYGQLTEELQVALLRFNQQSGVDVAAQKMDDGGVGGKDITSVSPLGGSFKERIAAELGLSIGGAVEKHGEI